MTTTNYYPEMNESEPQNVDGEITLSSWVGHWYVVLYTAKISGRGITDRGQNTKGHNTYAVTEKVKNQLVAKYNFSHAILLD
jgi:hypothetical protein